MCTHGQQGAFKSAEKRRKKQKTVEDTQETTQAEVVEVRTAQVLRIIPETLGLIVHSQVGSKTERRPIPEVTIPKRPPHDANIQPAEVRQSHVLLLVTRYEHVAEWKRPARGG